MNPRILNTPWAIFPPAAHESRIRLSQYADIEMEDFFTQRKPLSIVGTNAVIHVYGPLVDDAPPVAALVGMTDYRVVASEIDDAIAAGVESITFDIDSPGGMVSGLAELITRIDSANVVKVARCRGMACSAAYWIASACDVIQASASAILGSIGVVTVWTDYSKMDEMMGITINVMTNEGADLKGAGMGSTLSDSQIQFLQDSLNQTGADFRRYVEGNRPNIDPECFRAGHYSGQQVLTLGLADMLIA